jgi:N-acetylmuramoyl-L-alanine amidase
MSFYLLEHRNPNGDHFYTTRRQPIQIIVLHTTEQLPDYHPPDEGAEKVARYAATTTRKVSWHQTVDSDSIIPMLPDSFTAWHVRGYNARALGVEISTQARRWSTAPPDWVEKTITNLADVIRYWGELYQIPYHRIARANVDRGRRGIVAHADLDPTRRTDPGPDFPWGLLWTKLGLIVEEEMTLKQGDIGNAVKLFQKTLNRQGAGRGLADSGLFDEPTEEAVRRYQNAANLPITGQIDGITAALLSRYDNPGG